MKKIIYWLQKLGMLRIASYKVKGDASKMNEIVASDGGMIQTQKEIDEKYNKGNEKKRKKNQIK